MDTCPKCNSLLRIGTSFMTFENDDTPELETIAYTNLEMLCLNKECDKYAGENLTQPRTVVETITNRVN
jgi:hypothetical protein